MTDRARKLARQHRDPVLSAEGFNPVFIAELDKPAEVGSELAELFRRNPKLPEQ